ncbi:DUF551 domain-containing protein [Caballeronia sp. Sq4a]|uniref:DUF551 domain-containing protein n=1 Tax=Caballeronia sp. Sq4a TaxID=2878152 RepID=UPI0020BF246E|nr:DUF551 domain-containing protein [Caballeronia sp. Sq4a]
MDDVKPCPFCGKPPHVAEEMDEWEWWFVACRTPGCILPISGGHTSIESAIARWNRRAALASAPAQQWISVRDRLPAEGQPVMFVVASKYPDYNGRVFGGSFCMLADVPSFNTPGVGYRASHWMPLPEAPASSVASKEESTS